jgi:chemotaxis protein MotB
LFGSGSGTLNAAGLPMLGYLGEITSSLDVRAVVSGHADNDPISTAQFASNWELSAARAAGVARQLVAYGQDPEMVRVESFGEYRPVASNDTPEGRALNRRVEVFFARSDIIEAARRWAATGEPVPEFASSDEAPATGGAGIVDVIGGSEGG